MFWVHGFHVLHLGLRDVPVLAQGSSFFSLSPHVAPGEVPGPRSVGRDPGRPGSAAAAPLQPAAQLEGGLGPLSAGWEWPRENGPGRGRRGG